MCDDKDSTDTKVSGIVLFCDMRYYKDCKRVFSIDNIYIRITTLNFDTTLNYNTNFSVLIFVGGHSL